MRTCTVPALNAARPDSSPPGSKRVGVTNDTSDSLYELRTAFVNERFAPELLPHKDDLVRHVRAIVDAQVCKCPFAHVSIRVLYNLFQC